MQLNAEILFEDDFSKLIGVVQFVSNAPAPTTKYLLETNVLHTVS